MLRVLLRLARRLVFGVLEWRRRRLACACACSAHLPSVWTRQMTRVTLTARACTQPVNLSVIPSPTSNASATFSTEVVTSAQSLVTDGPIGTPPCTLRG